MESNIAKGLGRGREPHGGACLDRFAHHPQGCLWHTMSVRLLKKLAFTADGQLQA